MRRWLIGLLGVVMLIGAIPVHAASAYADPAFQTQWQQGETVTPNFWGPLTLAHDGQQEPYKEAAGGQRLVQYFDKGRMELTNGTVTNGLLATEIIKGQIQIGDATFQPKSPPTIPIAGDPSNTGPTYATAGQANTYLYTAGPGEPTFPRAINKLMQADGTLVSFDHVGNYPDVQILAADSATVRPVANVFGMYRDKVGLSTIGYAVTAPVWVNVTVGGAMREVLVQVFERRVLTYTASNDPAFRVEMGNIGQHYYQWRYGGAATQPVPVAAQPSAPAPAPQQSTPSPAPSQALTVVFSGVSSPVAHGNAANAAITTLPGAVCSITVTYKSGLSTAQGLVQKTADSNGRVVWSWIVGTNTTPGSWPVDVTCIANGQTAMQRTLFVVT